MEALHSFLVAINKSDTKLVTRAMSRLDPLLLDECTKLNKTRLEWERAGDANNKLREELWKKENELKRVGRELSQVRMERGVGGHRPGEVDKMVKMF